MLSADKTMEWSLPDGWKGKLSQSKGRWFYWHQSNPNATTWTPPSWNANVANSYNENLKADISSANYRSCQNFCKSAVLSTWLFAKCSPTMRVVDVGCGKGGDVAKVPPTLLYTGFDIANDALVEARRRYPTHSFVQADFTSSKSLADQLSGAKFDAAWSSFAFHYGGEELDVALCNIRSILHTGANFLFIVLDDQMETRYPNGFGPLQISKWEHRDVGPKGTCHAEVRAWVSFAGSFSNLPEPLLTRRQIEASCKTAKFTIETTELLGSAVSTLLNGWAVTPDEQAKRAFVHDLRSKYKDWRMWDSLHWEFANCYRIWLLKASE